MTSSDKALSNSVLVRYAFLALPLAAGFLALQVFVPSFYAEETGLGLTAIGFLLFASRVFDMVSDPLVGMLSDRTPERLGQRKIWVFAGAPLLMLALWLLFNPPDWVNGLYLMLVAVMVYAAGTMVIVPYYAWGAEVAPDYHDRSRISGARVVAGLVGTLAALGLPAILGTAETDLGTSLNAIFVLTLVTLVVALAVLVRVPDRPHAARSQASLATALRLFRRKTPLRQLLAAYLMNGTANGIPATLLIFFVTHVLEDRAIAGPLLFVYFAVSALAVPFWVWVSGKTSKAVAWRVSLVIACATFVWTPLLGAGDSTLFIVITLITGFATGADLSMPVAMQGDLVDWDAAVRGKARPGVFFAIWGTMTKLGFALGVGLTFPLLDLAGFDAKADSNSASAVFMLAALYAWLPVLLKVWALYLMRGYPITQERHEEIRDRLEERGIAVAGGGAAS